MDLLQALKNRRSVRAYTGEHISDTDLDMILKAGLLAPSGRNIKPWEFILVKDPAMLKKLAVCRPAGPGMLKNADCAIVVLGNTEATDVWTEDCSIAMAYMHLMADSLGIGSCWIQGRLRPAPDGRMAEDLVREWLNIPDKYALEAILSLGIPEKHPAAHTEDELLTDKIHMEKF